MAKRTKTKRTGGALGPGYGAGEITNQAVERYMMSLLPARDEVLAKIEKQASRRDIPIVGPAVGRVLHLLAQMIAARRVFELGSAVGYSTIWWARAVGATGRVVYTDGDPKKAAEAQGYFERAGVAERIDVRVGDALKILAADKGEYDIIFCDIDKVGYPEALKLAMPRVRRGGLIVADNVLYSARVTLPARQQNANTKGIVAFNRTLNGSKEFFTTILPIRDGVAVARKL